MARPVKKPNGKHISGYISKEVYERFMALKPPDKSISDYLEMVMRFYIEHYRESKEKGESIEHKHPFLELLKEHIKEGETWFNTLKSIGITEPRDIVRLLNEHTEFVKNSRRVRLIKGIDDWVLANINNAESDVHFVFHRIRRME